MGNTITGNIVLKFTSIEDAIRAIRGLGVVAPGVSAEVSLAVQWTPRKGAWLTGYTTDKIQAVKQVREITGFGLLDAKTAVEMAHGCPVFLGYVTNIEAFRREHGGLTVELLDTPEDLAVGFRKERGAAK